MRCTSLLSVVLLASAMLGSSPSRAATQSVTYTFKSGNSPTGDPDPLVWVQGVPVQNLNFPSSELPLQFAFVVDSIPNWGLIDGARWVSPTPDGVGPPGGYKYFVPFPVPPGLKSARLDIVWRADDVGGLHLNDMDVHEQSPAMYPPNKPAAEFHGDVTRFLMPGMNQLEFIVVNSRTGINPTGISFYATFVLTY